MKGKMFIALLIGCLFQVDCGKNPVGKTNSGSGEIHIWAQIARQSGGLAKKTATTWDSLIIKISSPDMDTIIKSVNFDSADLFINSTITEIPAGKGKLVEVYTKNKKNLIIHSGPGKKTDLASGEIKTLDFTLVPQRGSIYLNIVNIPSKVGNESIGSIYGSFIFDAGIFSDSIQRNKSVFLTIDNVPDGASGILRVLGIGTSGDTLYRSSQPFTFYASKDTTFAIQPGKLNTGIIVIAFGSLPSSTIVFSSWDENKVINLEHGPLIVTEVMYVANDSEYIEVYNSLDKDTTFDTLIIEVDGVFRYFSNISIKSKGFFVFGRKNLPWVNSVSQVASALDLLSGGGNVIAIRAKDSTLMDLLFFDGGSNSQEWPNISLKRSIVLDSIVSDPKYNNFGKHWLPAVSLINLVAIGYSNPITSQYGTPGFAGK
jgi:hypothetical protein